MAVPHEKPTLRLTQVPFPPSVGVSSSGFTPMGSSDQMCAAGPTTSTRGAGSWPVQGRSPSGTTPLPRAHPSMPRPPDRRSFGHRRGCDREAPGGGRRRIRSLPDGAASRALDDRVSPFGRTAGRGAGGSVQRRPRRVAGGRRCCRTTGGPGATWQTFMLHYDRTARRATGGPGAPRPHLQTS